MKGPFTSLREQGLAAVEQSYLTGPCLSLLQQESSSALAAKALHQTQQQQSSVSFKNVCNDALQSHPSGIPCFDPFLTQELTLNCSMCRRGSKARNFQTQKEELLSPPEKAEGEKNANQTP